MAPFSPLPSMDGTSRPPATPVNAQSLFVSAPSLDASGLAPPIMIHQLPAQADHPSDPACPISTKPFAARVPTRRLRWTEAHEASRLLAVQGWLHRYPKLSTCVLSFLALTVLFASFVSRHHQPNLSLSHALDPHNLAWVIKHARTGAGSPGIDRSVMRELADAIKQQDLVEAQRELMQPVAKSSTRRNVNVLGLGHESRFHDGDDDGDNVESDGPYYDNANDESSVAPGATSLASTNVGITAIGMNHHLLDSDLGAVVDSLGPGFGGSVARLVDRAKLEQRGGDVLGGLTDALDTTSAGLGPVSGNLASMTNSLSGAGNGLGASTANMIVPLSGVLGSPGSGLPALGNVLAPLGSVLPARDLPLANLVDLGSDSAQLASSTNVLAGRLNSLGGGLGSTVNGLHLKRQSPGTEVLDTVAASLGPISGNTASMTNSLSGMTNGLGGSLSGAVAAFSAPLGTLGQGHLRRSSVNRAVAAAKAERGLFGLAVDSPSFLFADLGEAVPDMSNDLFMRKRDAGSPDSVDDNAEALHNYPNPSIADSPGIACPDGSERSKAAAAAGGDSAPECVPSAPSPSVSSVDSAAPSPSTDTKSADSISAPTNPPSPNSTAASDEPESNDWRMDRRTMLSGHKRSHSLRART